jgi:hypothetical protein
MALCFLLEALHGQPSSHKHCCRVVVLPPAACFKE